MSEMRSLVIERDLPYPPEKIWRALTECALIQEWLMENDFAPVAGHEFQFRAQPVPQWNGIIESKVLVVEENRALSYTWGTMGVETTVIWTLTATESGTHLRLEQSGFGEGQDANYKGAKYGWQRFIGNLEAVLGKL